MSQRLQYFFVLVPLVGLFAGCGGSGRPPVAPANGIVTLDGVVVENAKVMFFPLQGGGSAFSHGTTGPDGKFTMSTFKMGDGALVGRCAVTVSKADSASQPTFNPAELSTSGYGGANYQSMMGPGAGKKKEEKQMLPKKFSDQKTSGIELVVENGQDNNFPLDLKSK